MLEQQPNDGLGCVQIFGQLVQGRAAGGAAFLRAGWVFAQQLVYQLHVAGGDGVEDGATALGVQARHLEVFAVQIPAGGGAAEGSGAQAPGCSVPEPGA